jgi:integrase
VRIFTGRDSQGKRQYLNKTIKGKKKDAETYLSKTITAISTGTFIEPSPMTVKQYLDRWLETVALHRVRERTFADYKELLNRYVTPGLGGKRLSDLRPLEIQTLYNYMALPKLGKDGKPHPDVAYGLGLSARTIRMLHSVLSSAFKQAVKWNMLAQNPCGAVELPRMDRKEMQAFSTEEAKRFLEAAKNDRFSVLFSFALATGMRPEEYLGLQWKDVDFENGTVTVRRTLLWRAGGGWYFDEPKTSRSRRTLPLPSTLVRELSEHKRRQAEIRLKAGAKYQNNDFVFATGEGTPLMRRNLIRRHFRPILKRANLPTSLR